MVILHKGYNNLFGHNAGIVIGNKLSHRLLKAVIRTMFALCMLLISQPGIHAQPSVSIRASAMVVDAVDIQLIPLNDMIIDESLAVAGFLNISPITDVTAGKIMVKGKVNAMIRLSYLHQQVVINTSGEGTLVFDYVVSGFPSDDQKASMFLDAPENVPQFNKEGEYYLWVGGQVNITNARPGNYEGEFILEIEYI
jgi:hypothetical protein